MKATNPFILGIVTAVGMALGSIAHGATVVGLNFARDGGGTTTGDAAGVLQANWKDVFDSDGFGGAQNIALNGATGVTASWTGQNSWWAGSNGTAEQRIYACYLDDWGSPTVTLSGMSTWLAAEGMTAYEITVFTSTDTANATWATLTLHSGGAAGPSLGTMAATNLPSGDPGEGGNSRGFGSFAGSFTDDQVTITSPGSSGSTRGTIAAIRITAIPEPSAILLGGLGLLALVRRRR